MKQAFEKSYGMYELLNCVRSFIQNMGCFDRKFGPCHALHSNKPVDLPKAAGSQYHAISRKVVLEQTELGTYFCFVVRFKPFGRIGRKYDWAVNP